MPSDKTPEERAFERSEELKGFYIHFGVFLITITGLFFIDIASGSEWWFFYPAIAWGVGLAIHAVVTIVNGVFDTSKPPRPVQEKPVRTPDATGNVQAQSAMLVDRMRAASRTIPNGEVRQRALAICASADQVLSAFEENPAEQPLARDFLARYLTPTHSIISNYARLASRNVAAVRPTLQSVESHDLPMIAQKIEEVHDRLHRGSLIDLEVAREMLSLDIADWDKPALTESGGT